MGLFFQLLLVPRLQGWAGISLLIRGFVHKQTPHYIELPG